MGRRDHARAFGQFLDCRRRRLDAVFGMKEEERTPGAPLDHIDPRSIDDERGCRALGRKRHPSPCSLLSQALLKRDRLF